MEEGAGDAARPARRGRPSKATPGHLTSPTGTPPIRRAGLHEEVRDRLRGMIVRGQLPPGSDIGEAGLSMALGVSRTPVREALKLLQVEGLVELRPHRGASIMPLRTAEILDLFEVSAGIERLGAELAAARASADQLVELRRLQELMERQHDAADRDAYFSLNQEIHRAVVAAGGNAVLTEVHAMLFARVERVRFLALSSRMRWDESVREHREILAALEVRDAALAGRLLAEHVLHTGKRAVALLRTANDGDTS